MCQTPIVFFMLPTSTSLYMRQPIPVPYNYGSQQPYFSGNSYSRMSQPFIPVFFLSHVAPESVRCFSSSSTGRARRHVCIHFHISNFLFRIVPGSSMFTASPMVPSHHIASTSANCDDSPAVTKKFNSYKEVCPSVPTLLYLVRTVKFCLMVQQVHCRFSMSWLRLRCSSKRSVI